MQIRHRISTKEAGRQMGFSQVSMWRKSKSESDFPKPVYIGSKKLWYQDEVTKWIEANERTKPAFNNLEPKKAPAWIKAKERAEPAFNSLEKPAGV